jgi:orotidine-5'-phosphate decarboxylase
MRMPPETPSRTALEAARARLVLALDVADLDTARALVERVRPHIGALKVGKELFTSCGPEAVRTWDGMDLPVFLDLKFHDIPNTVAGAVRAAGRLGARWLSLHTSGGAAMLQAAVEARDALPEPRPRLLGVTVLTSLDDPLADVEEIVERALLAQRSGLDGAIASPQEVARLRAACGRGFLLVTPGVRPAGVALGDQKRVATPGDAVRDGADLLVLGRPIAAAADPAAAAAAVCREIAAELASRGRDAAPPADESAVEVRLLRLLRDSAALLEGHFILSSGLHSDRYVQCAKLLQHPAHARRAGAWLADRLRTYRVEAVLSPALGGVVIGQEAAAALGVPALFAERDGSGILQLRRGFELRSGQRLAVVDDVCTRGGSFAECIAVARAHGAQPVVAGAIIDRSGGTHRLEVPLEALRRVEARAYLPDECPACARGEPAVKPGSRTLTA